MKAALMNLAAVALGGAMGAVLRYAASSFAHLWLGWGFPYGTLLVNVLGSLSIGYVLEWMASIDQPMPMLRLLLVTGVLGGFTTYSAFTIETLRLFQEGQAGRAGVNVLLTLGLCFIAVWAGFALGRALHGSS